MTTKTRFMIAAISIGMVRDGKRVTIQPGGGDNFTQDEIDTLNRLHPGALRAPINEGRGSDADDEGSDEGAGSGGEGSEGKSNKPASGGKGGKGGKTKKPVKPAADEDEDI